MDIRLTTYDDLPTVMGIYAKARAFMAAHGNPRQWGARNWPPEEVVRADIAQGKGHVCVHDGTVVGAFFFDVGPDVEPTYRTLEGGRWQHEGSYGVVHRLASSGEVRGVGSACVRWACGQCAHLRIDTHPDNVVMQGMLEKLGFERRGIIHIVEDDDPRIAYER